MVRDRHRLERDLLGVFEVRIWTPHALQPFYIEQPAKKEPPPRKKKINHMIANIVCKLIDIFCLTSRQ